MLAHHPSQAMGLGKGLRHGRYSLNLSRAGADAASQTASAAGRTDWTRVSDATGVYDAAHSHSVISAPIAATRSGILVCDYVDYSDGRFRYTAAVARFHFATVGFTTAGASGTLALQQVVDGVVTTLRTVTTSVSEVGASAYTVALTAPEGGWTPTLLSGLRLRASASVTANALGDGTEARLHAVELDVTTVARNHYV